MNKEILKAINDKQKMHTLKLYGKSVKRHLNLKKEINFSSILKLMFYKK